MFKDAFTLFEYFLQATFEYAFCQHLYISSNFGGICISEALFAINSGLLRLISFTLIISVMYSLSVYCIYVRTRNDGTLANNNG